MLAAAAPIASSACGPDDLQRCRAALDRGDSAQAAPLCLALYQAAGETEAGRLAARALLNKGDLDQAAAVERRLAAGGDVAGAGLIRGRIAVARRQTGEAQAELVRAREQAAARGDGETAARALYHLYALHRAAGRLGEALAALARAETGVALDRFPDLRRQIAFARFDILHDIGDFDRAERALRAALPTMRPDDAPYVRFKEGLIYKARGHLQMALVDFAQAARLAAERGRPEFVRAAYSARVDTLLEADRVAEAAAALAEGWAALPEAMRADPATEASWLVRRVRVDRLRGDLDGAERHLARARQLTPRNQDVRWELEFQDGLNLEARGETERAAVAFERAIAAVEAMRGDVAPALLRDRVLALRRAPYGALYDLHARAGAPARALAVAERAQARSFLDAFAQPPRRSRDEGTGLWPWAERLDALGGLLPALAASPVAAVRPVEESLRALAPGDHALVYFESRGRLRLARASRAGVTTFAIEPGAQEVATWVARFRARPWEREWAARLGAALVPPEALPPEGARLTIVPSPGLARLPFAALLVGGRRLVSRHDLAFAPSLTALAALSRGRAGAAAGATMATPPPVIVLGDPQGDLPAARAEADRLAERVPRAQVWRGRDATIARLRAAGPAAVLHLAAHSGVAARGAWLRLADGEVSASDLLAWSSGQRAPRLVVLASCASAISAEEGLWGSLAGSFLAAGAQAVLSTLWSVDDSATREVIDRFYAHGGAADPIAALARTQRDLAAADPQVWAPFVILGALPPASPPPSWAATQPTRERRP